MLDTNLDMSFNPEATDMHKTMHFRAYPKLIKMGKLPNFYICEY